MNTAESIIKPQKIAIFSPHPDDATLGCGGIICKRLTEHRETHIVYMTDGRNSHLLTFGIKENPTPLQLKELRKNEAHDAQRVLGNTAENLHFIDVEDGLLLLNKKVAVKKTVELLNLIRPSVVLVPYHIDRHPDHMATYEVVVRAVKTSKLPISTCQYFIWSLLSIVNTPLEATPMICVNVGTELETKKTAISCFKTQVTNFSPYQSIPQLDSNFLRLFVTEWEYFLEVGQKIETKKAMIINMGRTTIAAYQNLLDLRMFKKAE